MENFHFYSSEPDWDASAIDDLVHAGLLRRDVPVGDFHLPGLIYLATPYSKMATTDGGEWSSNGSITAAFHATAWAAGLASRGMTAISPIIQAAAMVDISSDDALDPLDAGFWRNWCLPLLRSSSAVVIPPVPGWMESVGIWMELREAVRSCIPVILLAEER